MIEQKQQEPGKISLIGVFSVHFTEVKGYWAICVTEGTEGVRNRRSVTSFIDRVPYLYY